MYNLNICFNKPRALWTFPLSLPTLKRCLWSFHTKAVLREKGQLWQFVTFCREQSGTRRWHNYYSTPLRVGLQKMEWTLDDSKELACSVLLCCHLMVVLITIPWDQLPHSPTPTSACHCTTTQLAVLVFSIGTQHHCNFKETILVSLRLKTQGREILFLYKEQFDFLLNEMWISWHTENF